MKKTKGGGKSMKMQSRPAVRASITFPAALYQTLEDIAKQKKVFNRTDNEEQAEMGPPDSSKAP